MKPEDNLNTLLDVIMDRAGQQKWFALPIPSLGGRTPMQAINDGDLDKVIALAKSYGEPPAFT